MVKKVVRLGCRLKKWGVALVLACAFLVGCMYVSNELAEENFAKVTFLDVGQGLAVLFEYDGKFAMYDAGPDSVGVMDSLQARGVDTLQWVMASHYHRDHVGGLFELGVTSASVLPSSRGPVVKRLYVGLDTTGGFIRDSLFRLAHRLNISVDTVVRGDSFSLCGRDSTGFQFQAMWPPEFIPLGGNEASVVLDVRLTTSGRGGAESFGSILLTGDLDSISERRLLEISPSLGADLLQVPHHGSSGSNSLKFLSQLAPRFAVVSVGANNGYGHPTKGVLQKLKYVLGDTAAVYRTDLNGSVEFQVIPGVGVVP